MITSKDNRNLRLIRLLRQRKHREREGLARAAEWGVPLRRPTNPSPRRRGFLSAATPGVPLGKRPSPADYAKAAVFLASDDAAMITGTDLRVDAGALARYWMWDPSVPPA